MLGRGGARTMRLVLDVAGGENAGVRFGKRGGGSGGVAVGPVGRRGVGGGVSGRGGTEGGGGPLARKSGWGKEAGGTLVGEALGVR